MSISYYCIIIFDIKLCCGFYNCSIIKYSQHTNLQNWLLYDTCFESRSTRSN